jgi:hypothetical protein
MHESIHYLRMCLCMYEIVLPEAVAQQQRQQIDAEVFGALISTPNRLMLATLLTIGCSHASALAVSVEIVCNPGRTCDMCHGHTWGSCWSVTQKRFLAQSSYCSTTGLRARLRRKLAAVHRCALFFSFFLLSFEMAICPFPTWKL